ncbi:hypothetical protein ACJ6WF_44130 [Streptomyces sp. MMS24-I2-30]|uniref:hypothetical protein n=1 Tax=Streptomyces sp. MMS24-I2-30 TaxID=3351564 RepID=UPI0038968B43
MSPTRQIAEQEIGLLGALFTGMRSDPRLAEEMRRILRRDEAAMTDEPLHEAVQRGEQLTPRTAELLGREPRGGADQLANAVAARAGEVTGRRAADG